MILSRRFLLCKLAALTLAGSLSLPALAANPQVEFVTNQGNFTMELYPDKAPKTVKNFLKYVEDKHYDDTIFHRVIPGFMVQGGGYDSDYKEKKTRAPVTHEGRQALQAGLKNERGFVAMARTNAPHSATAQFFINVEDNERLDPVIIPEGDPVEKFEYMGQTYQNVPRADLENHPMLYGYTVFGKIIDGMDTVDKIRDIPTGSGGPFPTDAPQEMVTIESARLLP